MMTSYVSLPPLLFLLPVTREEEDVREEKEKLPVVIELEER